MDNFKRRFRNPIMNIYIYERRKRKKQLPKFSLNLEYKKSTEKPGHGFGDRKAKANKRKGPQKATELQK
jgi:hypothetical protein